MIFSRIYVPSYHLSHEGFVPSTQTRARGGVRRDVASSPGASSAPRPFDAASVVVVTNVVVNRNTDGLESSLSQSQASVFKWNRLQEVRARREVRNGDFMGAVVFSAGVAIPRRFFSRPLIND